MNSICPNAKSDFNPTTFVVKHCFCWQVEEVESELRLAKSSSRENESSVGKLRKDLHDVVAGNEWIAKSLYYSIYPSCFV